MYERAAAPSGQNSPLKGKNYPASVKEYLISRGLPLDKHFRCLSPEHADAHPSMSYDARRDKVHCFSCGVTYDLVDLLVLGGAPKNLAVLAKRGNGAKLKEIPFKGHYWLSRGFTNETISRFGLYEEKFCAVIPFGGGYNLKRGKERKCYYNPKGLPTRLYDPENAEGLVVVVEGAIDAISVLQAAAKHIEPRIFAIGLNSVSNAALLALHPARNDSVYCLALDNDAQGREAQAKLAALLKARGIRCFIESGLYGTHKDANEALCADSAAFAEALARLRARYLREYASQINAHAVQEASYMHDAPKIQDVYSTHDVHDTQPSHDTQHEQQFPLRSNADFLDGLFQSGVGEALKTGIPALDAITGGLPNGLTVLGALSAAGKTTLCLQIADNIAKRGRDVLFFTLEMSRRDLTLKSLSRETAQAMASSGLTAVPVNEIAQNKNSKSVQAALESYSKYAGRVFMIEPPAAPTPGFIERAVHAHIDATQSVPFVVIDYLQLLKPDENSTRAPLSDKQVLDKTVAALKRLCRECGVAVLAISSLNRQAYNAPEIAMDAFKESGAIEYSGDLLLGLKLNGSAAAVSVVKNRYGPAGAGRSAKLIFHAAYGCFE